MKLKDCQVISEEMAVQVCSTVHEPIPEETKVSYNFRKRLSSRKEENLENVKKPTKRFLWYEQKPFDDPVKEAKRLRNLSQKIYDDKRRFDYEILKAENKDLREENVKLKEEIQKLLRLGISSEKLYTCEETFESSLDSSVSDVEDEKLVKGSWKVDVVNIGTKHPRVRGSGK